MTKELAVNSEFGKRNLSSLQDDFNSAKWKDYFERNKNARLEALVGDQLKVDEKLTAPLIHSLQRFQIGETGDGLHLKKYASSVKDKDYQECVDLFIKEEQGHAQVLARVILALDGTLITWHWSDFAFIGLRRLLGLKTELLVLLIAEVIGKSYYKLVSKNAGNETIEEVFSLIVLDELMHLEFHTEFLSSRLKNYSMFVRSAVYRIWCFLFWMACLVFVMDHGKSLSNLGSGKKEFWIECTNLFSKYAKRACLLSRKERIQERAS